MDEGKRFSLIYLDRSTPLKDSQRFRNRLAAYYKENLHEHHCEKIKKEIEKEIGVEVSYKSYFGWDLPGLFKKVEFRDVLDSITTIFQAMGGSSGNRLAGNWMEFVSRVLSEENMGYRLDSQCGVHYHVDEEFERNRFSTLSVLENPKYGASMAAYEDAYRYMDSNPPGTKATVRSMFESLEILVKQIVKTRNLNKWIVENTLKEKCLKLYGNDETAIKTVSELFNGFAKWVNALHNYRHGQKSDEPVAPSEEVAVYVLSSGSSFLRWLISLNNALE